MELDEKLKIFRGKKDDKKEEDEDLGKLLEDEEKEEIEVSSETIKKIISMAGGIPFVVLLVMS
jgi:hypothetical protein